MAGLSSSAEDGELAALLTYDFGPLAFTTALLIFGLLPFYNET